MAVRPVLQVPHPTLRKKAHPIDKVDDAVRQLFDDMVDTMRFHDGCGLAANQIGDLRRIIVLEFGEEGQPDHVLYKMANPQVVWRSDTKVEFSAGCLSVPEEYVPIARCESVEVTYLDEHNELRKVRLSGIVAHGVLHEIDHLDGVVIVDYLSPFQRRQAEKKLKKREASLN